VEPAQSLTPEEQQLQALRDQLAAQKSVLSAQNPKIKLLRTQIAALEAIVNGTSSSSGKGDNGREVSAYDVQLAELNTQLDQSTAQQAVIEEALRKLQATIDATPGNATALEALQRDYDNLKTRYDLAVDNEARAQTGDTIEASAQGQHISVIEPAVAPTSPKSPNRKVIAVAGVGGGILLGLGLVALLEWLNAGIRRPEEITAKLGVSVFATLPYLALPGETGRRKLGWAIVILLVGCVAALLLALNTYYMPLNLLLAQLSS